MLQWRRWLRRGGLKILYPCGKHRGFDSHLEYKIVTEKFGGVKTLRIFALQMTHVRHIAQVMNIIKRTGDEPLRPGAIYVLAVL